MPAIDNFEAVYIQKRRHIGLLSLGLRLRAQLVRPHLPEGCSILDVGAADGAMLALLVPQVRPSRFVNLDPNGELVKLAPNGVHGSGTDIPFPDASFERVVCCATRKHVRNSRKLMSEMARVLVPAGEAIIVDPRPVVLKIGIRVRKFDPRYVHHFSTALDIAAEAESCGLKVMSCTSGLFVCVVGKKL